MLPIGDLEFYQTVQHVGHPILVEGQVDIVLLIASQPGVDFGDAGTGSGQSYCFSPFRSLGGLGAKWDKALGVERIRKRVGLELFKRISAGQGMIIHVVVKATLFWHAPANAPFVGIGLVGTLIADNVLKPGSRTWKHLSHICGQPFGHVLIHEYKLLGQLANTRRPCR